MLKSTWTTLAFLLAVPFLAIAISPQCAAQTAAPGETRFPEIVGAQIPGAPELSQPILIMGSTQPLLTEKHGLAGPALWDWDGDGKRDLLLGEFKTGDGPDDSNIRVYFNQGTDSKPNFTDEFEYARDTQGNKIAVYQW